MKVTQKVAACNASTADTAPTAVPEQADAQRQEKGTGSDHQGSAVEVVEMLEAEWITEIIFLFFLGALTVYRL